MPWVVIIKAYKVFTKAWIKKIYISDIFFSLNGNQHIVVIVLQVFSDSQFVLQIFVTHITKLCFKCFSILQFCDKKIVCQKTQIKYRLLYISNSQYDFRHFLLNRDIAHWAMAIFVYSSSRLFGSLLDWALSSTFEHFWAFKIWVL